MAPRKPASVQPPLPLPPLSIPRSPVYSVWPARVESRESLDLIVAEIARLDALAERVKADTKDEVGELQRRATERLLVPVEGRPEGRMPLADRRAELVAAAKTFCDKHRDELLEDGCKSFDVTFGRLGWRDAPPGLEPLPGFDEDGNQKILKELLADLRKALQRLADFADGGSRFVDIEVAWRKKELLSAHLDQELPLSILRKTGFTIRDEEEKFYVTPKTNDVASQSAERPQAQPAA